MRLILLGFLLHWKEQFPVGGMPIFTSLSFERIFSNDQEVHVSNSAN